MARECEFGECEEVVAGSSQREGLECCAGLADMGECRFGRILDAAMLGHEFANPVERFNLEIFRIKLWIGLGQSPSGKVLQGDFDLSPLARTAAF